MAKEMTGRTREVISTAGILQVQITFERRDLLYSRYETICGQQRPLLNPALRDMLVRRRWSLEDLPAATKRALIKAHARKRSGSPKHKWTELPAAVTAWSVCDSPAPNASSGHRDLAPPADGAGDMPGVDRPLLGRLAAADTQEDSVAGECVAVHRRDTCQINDHLYRATVSVYGGLDKADRHIAGLAKVACEADVERTRLLWRLVRTAPGEVLVEDERVSALRPFVSLSQEVEGALMDELCQWL